MPTLSPEVDPPIAVPSLEKIGVDIGRVIIAANTANPDSSIFGANYLQCPPVEGAINGMRQIVDSGMYAGVYLVSKCQPRTQRKTMEWLYAVDFFNTTGVQEEDVHFCLHRDDKATIAAALGLTTFIDDRSDVLSPMTTVPRRILFVPPSSDPPVSSAFTVARGWHEVLRITT